MATTTKNVTKQPTMATSTKTSLEAIPLLKGRQNYTSWSKQIESHLKASNAWQVITGRWKKPPELSHFEAPLRPQDLITEHRERRQQEEDAQADGRRQTADAKRRRQTADARRRRQTADARRRPQTA